MKLQKKALQHVSDLLRNKYDTYQVYLAISKLLDELNIANPQKSKILDTLSDENAKLKNVVIESREWVNTMIEDLDLNKQQP